MATKSMPTVPCLPASWATLSFVPTPSVPETSSGSAMSLAAAMLNKPPNPPMSPTTSGRYVECTVSLMASTARAPSAVSTPAAWYVTSCFVTGCSLSDRREPDRPCGQRSRTVNLPKPGHLGTHPYLSGFARAANRRPQTADTPPPPFTWRQAAQLRTLNATSPNCPAKLSGVFAVVRR